MPASHQCFHPTSINQTETCTTVDSAHWCCARRNKEQRTAESSHLWLDYHVKKQCCRPLAHSLTPPRLCASAVRFGSTLVILHPHTRADRFAVTEDVLHAGDGQPTPTWIKECGMRNCKAQCYNARAARSFAAVRRRTCAHAASTRAQRISSSRNDSRAVSGTAVTAMVSPTALKTSME
jgi:hypothetical protein